MHDNIDIALFLEEDESNSKLKAAVYGEELKEINIKFPINKGQVDIKKIFLNKNINILEAEFFIRNASDKSVSFEDIVLSLQDKDGNIIISQEFNLKEMAAIPPYSAAPYNVTFELNNDINYNENEVYNIKFSNVNEFYAFSSVETVIENMPIDISFEEEKSIRDFANNLPTLKKDDFSISIYNIKYNNNKGIDCTLLLRNGSEKVPTIEVIPVSLLDENGELIVRKVFNNENDLFTVNPSKAKIVNLEFNEFELPAKAIYISKCKLEIK